MTIEQLITWALTSLIGTIAAFGVKFLWEISRSNTTLTKQIAVMIERLKTVSEVLEDHEARIRRVEGRRR